MAAKPSALVRVVPVPGLHFEPVDTTPEEAAALVASGSFAYADAPSAPTQAAPAAEDLTDDAG